MNRRAARAVIAVVMLSCACASAQRKGDAAAALGSWVEAVSDYEEAVRDDPKSGELQVKLQNARKQASAVMAKKGLGCASQNDWDCAVASVDAALRYTPDEPALLAQRKDAVEQYIFKHQGAARDAASHNLFPTAFREMNLAINASMDPELTAALRSVQQGFVTQAVALAEKDVQAQEWPQAIELFAEAAKADPSRKARLDEVRAQYDRILQEKAELVAQQGDAALFQGDFRGAEQQYRAALAIHGGGRAQLQLQVAGPAVASRAAADGGDWTGALRDIESALGATSDERLRPRLSSMKSEYVSSALIGANQLAGQNSWPEAIALYDAVGAAEPSQSGRAAQARQEFQAYQERLAAERARQQAQLAREAEDLARRGDAARAQRDWRSAEDAYRAANEKAPGGRADRLARYAHAMSQGDIEQKEGRLAAAHFSWKTAVETGADDGTAAALLNSQAAAAGSQQPGAGPGHVRPPPLTPHDAGPPMARPFLGQPWAIGVGRVSVNPVYPDGRPLFPAPPVPPNGRPMARPFQQPKLSIELQTPDGPAVRSPQRDGVLVPFHSQVVIGVGLSPAGVVRVRVLHDNSVELGVVEIPLRELVLKRHVGLRGGSVTELELTAEPAPGRQAGELRELSAP